MLYFKTLISFLFLTSFAIAGPVDDARLDYIAGKYEKAMKVLIPAAEAGDANAQNIVGVAHENGHGVPKDFTIAKKWFEKAAAQNFDKATYNLGKLLVDGAPGVAIDPKRAEQLLSKLVAKNYFNSHNELGRLYALGHLGQPDFKKALELYQKAHDSGDITGTSNLGAAYAKGEGTEVDYAKAYGFIKLSADNGKPQSLHNMGVLFENGYNVKKDLNAARFYYLEALASNYLQSAVHLSDLLQIEGHYWTNKVDALAYCMIAEAGKNASAGKSLKVNCKPLMDTTSSDEKAQAKERMTVLQPAG